MADNAREVTPRKRIGRPRSPEPSSTVSVWVRASEHDTLIARASRIGLSVSGYLRQVIRRELRRSA